METSQQSRTTLPVLLVDDEIHALQGYEIHLLGEGISNFISCQSGKEALEIVSSQEVSMMLLDLRMPGISGEEVLAAVSEKYPHIPVVVITAVNEVETAVRCMKAGAFDYIVKPVDQTRLITTVKRALEFRELRYENVLLTEGMLDKRLRHSEAFSDIITSNEKMYSIFKYIESIAITPQPVLITGETGVGKELIARAIHRLSDRKGGLVAVNVAGLDDTTFSDSLFGHTRGAFTGAERIRAGLIEQAADGTLFLDEIGDLPSTSQVKLLRLLQEREYYPLGADVPRPTNARIIVATNHDLLTLQESGTFRMDLYYRLMLHHVTVPPLRERRDDIPLLVECFLQQSADDLKKPKPTPPPELFTLLSIYGFPGNIRELQAMIFDAVSCHESGKLSLHSFKEIIQHQPSLDLATSSAAMVTLETLYASLEQLPTLKESEVFLIKEALKRADDNQTLAATLLGITRQTLHNRLQAKK